MALWGNKDSVYSVGTVAVDLTTGIGTGAVGVVTWTNAGIKTGDVLTVGTGGTFGQAVVTGFTSTTISTASTANFITGIGTILPVAYNISQQPIYTLGDSSFNNRNDADASFTSYGVTGTATTNAATGSSFITVSVGSLDVVVGDAVVNDGNNLVITAIGAGSTNVTLASTTSAGISTGDTISFKRNTGGYYRDVFGVDLVEVGVATATSYAVAHSGWVGIQTYLDTHGNLRVKTETLVAGNFITGDADDDTILPNS